MKDDDNANNERDREPPPERDLIGKDSETLPAVLAKMAADGGGKAGNQPAYIRVEGGFLFGWIPKDEWEKRRKPDRRNLARADHERLIRQFRGERSAEERD